MQFFLLLMFNVFMGAVIYLVISLKVEKTADDYRKNKFRKEMDAVITEFNKTAERNISLLENRIEIIRNLMDKSGDMQHVNYLLKDEELKDEVQKQNKEPQKIINDKKNEMSEQDDSVLIKETSSAKKSLLLLKKRVIDKFEQISSSSDVETENSSNISIKDLDSSPVIRDKNRGSTIDYTIKKDLSQELKNQRIESEKKSLEIESHEQDMSFKVLEVEESLDKQIDKIVSESSDTYNLVAELNKIGCSTEEIALHAGLPAGEVHLVLNLMQS